MGFQKKTQHSLIVKPSYILPKNNQVVGRIAVMINHKEGQELDIHKVRFGWIDFIDDINVSKALIEKSYRICQTA